jgi:DNA-binding NtrC family response regulator
MDDVALLAKFFVKNFVTDFSAVKDISKEALICLQNYHWPGNIRELENVIRRAIALGTQEFIQPEDLPPGIVLSPDEPALVSSRPAEDSLEAYEKAAIQNALAKSRNSRRKAAEMLGIAEATLYRKITKYGLIS